MTEASSREGDGSDTDSVDSLGPRARHPTWSHSQHQAGHRHTVSNQEHYHIQEHRRKMSQFRLRATSVSKATQTGAQEEEEQYVDDVEVVADGEVEAAVVEDRENMVIASSCTDYDEEHGLVSLNEETTCF